MTKWDKDPYSCTYFTYASALWIGRGLIDQVFRLLKNNMADATGTSAYTEYTDQALEALGLDDFTENLIQLTET